MNYNESELRELLNKATVDCYDEHEEFWGFYTMLDDCLPFPFYAKVVGEAVTVIGLESENSSMFGGVHASVLREENTYVVSLTSLKVDSANVEAEKWLAAYSYWTSLG